MNENNQKPLRIHRRGDDDSKVITIRVRESTLKKIDIASKDINCSRNELINLMLEHGLDSLEIV